MYRDLSISFAVIRSANKKSRQPGLPSAVGSKTIIVDEFSGHKRDFLLFLLRYRQVFTTCFNKTFVISPVNLNAERSANIGPSSVRAFLYSFYALYASSFLPHDHNAALLSDFCKSALFIYSYRAKIVEWVIFIMHTEISPDCEKSKKSAAIR